VSILYLSVVSDALERRRPMVPKHTLNKRMITNVRTAGNIEVDAGHHVHERKTDGIALST
jgi:hypothetical protein